MSSPIKKEVNVKLEPDSIQIGNGRSVNGNDGSNKPGSNGSSSGSQNGTPKATANSSAGWQDIPLKACTKKEVEDARFHIMKFQNTRDVDIMNDFIRPVRLHRKDPRNIQFQLTRKQMDERKREKEAKKKERERLRAQGIEVEDEEEEADPHEMLLDAEDPTRKWERQNAMDLTQVAPDGGGRKARRSLFKRKTRQVSSMDEKKRKLRYEEHYPWVIEDYEGANVFVGNYEAGSSETQHVLFVFDKDGFKMVPAEKVYRFTPRNKYATLTLEEAEAKMEKKSAVPRWLMKHMEEGGGENDSRYGRTTPGAVPGRPIAPAQGSGAGRGLRTVLGGSSSNDRDSDHDDLDFDEEFADDEEAPIMEGDEDENKMSEQKMKKDMLKAAHLFEGQAQADDDDDLDDLFETETRKVDKEGKKLRKVLNKTEGGVYDSDDDDKLNPYLSRSDLESDDDSDIDSAVKKEDEGIPDKPTSRSLIAHNVGDGFVVIKAPQSFLKGFPRGEWTANGRKRGAQSVVSPRKKVKSEEPGSLKIKIKTDRAKSPSPTNTPGASKPSGVDLNSSGPNNLLVTVNEVLDIVRDNPLTTKELLVSLKSRVSAHSDNKMRIISIVKENLRLVDGKLVLKE